MEHARASKPCAGPAVRRRRPHQHVGVVTLHPGLLVHVGDVELAAGGVGHHLVVLLQNLVDALRGRREQGGCATPACRGTTALASVHLGKGMQLPQRIRQLLNSPPSSSPHGAPTHHVVHVDVLLQAQEVLTDLLGLLQAMARAAWRDEGRR